MVKGFSKMYIWSFLDIFVYANIFFKGIDSFQKEKNVWNNKEKNY